MNNIDLGLAMNNIELVQDIFIYYDVFKFYFHRSITFLVIVQKHGNTETQKHTQTLDEYSIIAFCKNATITNVLIII